MENVIKVTINKKEDILNSFNNELISEEFAEYLLKHTLVRKNKITNKIVIKGTTDTEIDSLIHDYFLKRINYINVKDKVDDKLEVFILFLGIILLIGYYLTSSLNVIIISEILLISGWVLVWEWFYKKIFNETLEKYEKKKCIYLSNIVITHEK